MAFVSYIAMALSIIGALLVAKQSWIGWCCWIVANVFWMVYTASNNMTAQLILWTYYLCTASYGLYVCVKKKVKDGKYNYENNFYKKEKTPL